MTPTAPERPAAPNERERTVSRRFFIETWGCQMNELDTQRMAGQLMQQCMLPTRLAGEADVLLLNSCSVRENAKNKVYSRIGEYRSLKQERETPDGNV
jgi:tRNA-2-methylthio-N6-dimethylallyladenosine synthase